MNERGAKTQGRPYKWRLVTVLVCSTIGIGVGALAQVDEAQPFATSWILVRLETPLEPLDPHGSFSVRTGRPRLDDLIEQEGVEKIEFALPVSTREPGNPAAFRRHGLDRTYRFHVPEGSDILRLVERFGRLGGVEYAEPDYVSQSQSEPVSPNDPLLVDQWNLHNTGQEVGSTPDADIDAPEAWGIATGEDVILGIIDTGIDLDHLDLAAKLVEGHDFVNDDSDPDDDAGHGTAVASIASALTDNGEGIAGVCWDCQLMPLKAFDENGVIYYAFIADAMVWATDHGARVLNTSGGGPAPSLTLLSGMFYAYDAGVMLVSGAGNESANAIGHPARYFESFAIGATDSTDQLWPSSNFGPQIDVVAPGVSVPAAVPWGYQNVSGTSHAAPHVTGLLGVMETVHPSVGREEARHLIHTGAEDEVGNPAQDTPGYDIYHGWGRLNMHRTLQATESSITLRVEGKEATRVFFETPNPLADSYDFVRGDLASLTETWAGVDLGDVVCLENDSPDPDTSGNDDLGMPDPGKGFLYLARFNGAAGAGSYGGSSSNRDRAVSPTVHSLAWTAESDQAQSYFGISVHGAGDVNADGYDDVIVGASLYDNGQDDEGAAFVYLGSPEGLQSSPVWSAEGDQAGARFGWSVAGAGDVNDDGHDDVIVSAIYHDNGQVNEGRAYVYLGNLAGLDDTPDWVAESNQAGAQFGWVVRPAGDINGDGYDDVSVVAILYDNGHTDEGKVFVYTGSESGLSASPAWSFEPDQAAAYLSGAGTAGDVNGDGFDDLIVGANEYDSPELNEGRAWIFNGSASGLPGSPTTVLEIDMPGAFFGYSTYTAGDVNGDDYDDVIISAVGYTNGIETTEGAAFVYLGSAVGVAKSPAWSFESDQADAFLGWSAETAGDVNEDGYDDVIVSTESYDLTRTDQGGAWVFLGSPSGLSTDPDWTGSGMQPDARYGYGAAGAGDVNGDELDDVIVGARRSDNGETNEGRAFVYHGPLSATTTTDCSVDAP